jgi:hypothetical protein
MKPEVRQFLTAKVRALSARARRLARLTHQTVGIRPGDLPYTPSAAHFQEANVRLAEIDRDVRAGLDRLDAAMRAPQAAPQAVLRTAALVERQIDRARRAFALYFDIFGQRGTSFAPALAAADEVAADCFRHVRQSFPGLLPNRMLKPVSFVDPSFSPATFRRGVMMRRLLGERNPFPLVRVPHERLESPWGFGVVLHEVGHNLQADLGVWQETEAALRRRVLQASGDAWLTRIWTRWQKEIFADCIAILLGGPASALGMKDFLAYPAPRVLHFRPMGVHPVPFLRGFLMAEMVRRAGFPDEAARIERVWSALYGDAARTARVPPALLDTAPRIIPVVIDEVAFQPRRNLAGHALADVVPFDAHDQASIRTAARQLGAGPLPPSLPPRFAVSAARYALDHDLAPPDRIARAVIRHLTRSATRSRGPDSATLAA